MAEWKPLFVDDAPNKRRLWLEEHPPKVRRKKRPTNPGRADRNSRKDRTSVPPKLTPSVYESYIASDAWADRRQLYFESHPRACATCGAVSQIQLHHLSYEHMWEEPDEDLLALCQRCHAGVHVLHRGSGLTLRAATERFVAESRRRRMR